MEATSVLKKGDAKSSRKTKTGHSRGHEDRSWRWVTETKRNKVLRWLVSRKPLINGAVCLPSCVTPPFLLQTPLLPQVPSPFLCLICSPLWQITFVFISYVCFPVSSKPASLSFCISLRCLRPSVPELLAPGRQRQWLAFLLYSSKLLLEYTWGQHIVATFLLFFGLILLIPMNWLSLW